MMKLDNFDDSGQIPILHYMRLITRLLLDNQHVKGVIILQMQQASFSENDYVTTLGNQSRRKMFDIKSCFVLDSI